MPIIQVPLDVPEDVYRDVLKGKLEILGMAKDAHHRVRKHIPRAKVAKADKAPEIKKTGVLQVIKDHKVGVIVVGVAAAVAGVGTYAYQSWKENKREEAERRVEDFKKALQEYLNASRKGNLNTKVVDNLLKSIEELEEKKLGKDIELTIPAAQLAELINSIFTYTESLAKANEFKAKVKKPKSGTNGSIVSLKTYLEIQKQILESAA